MVTYFDEYLFSTAPVFSILRYYRVTTAATTGKEVDEPVILSCHLFDTRG